jgi:hypothetical protein
VPLRLITDSDDESFIDVDGEFLLQRLQACPKTKGTKVIISLLCLFVANDELRAVAQDRETWSTVNCNIPVL